MLLHARGWGIAVPILFAFWLWTGIALMLVSAPYEPNAHKAMVDVEWCFAAGFALYALSVGAIVAMRRRRAKAIDNPTSLAPPEPDLRGDEFMFIRLAYWPYILFAVALAFAGAAGFGYSIF